MPDSDGWDEWRRYILKELERLNDNYSKLSDVSVNMRSEIAALKVRAGVWGAIGGAIPVAAGILWQLVIR